MSTASQPRSHKPSWAPAGPVSSRASEAESGSWRNPAVEGIQRQRPAPRVNRVSSYALRTTPRLSGLRKFLCLLLAVTALLMGASGGLAYWAQKNFVETQGFSAISAQMAHDREFQDQLAQAVTYDLMKAPAIEQYLGDGNSKNIFNPIDILGSTKDWGYEQVEKVISSTASTVVTAENYPQVWNQIMIDTHAYNLDDAHTDSAIDITPLYREVDQRVGTFMGFDPDLVGDQPHLVKLDATNGVSLNATVKNIRDFATTWQMQLMGSAGALILAFLLWPRGRLLFIGMVGLLAGCLLWFGSLAAAGISSAAETLKITSSVGQVFVQELANQYARSLSDFASSWVAPVLITSAILIALGIATQLASLTTGRPKAS